MHQARPSVRGKFKPNIALEIGTTILVHTSSPMLKKDGYERFACLVFDRNIFFNRSENRKEIIETAISTILDKAAYFWNLRAMISANELALDRLTEDILFPQEIQR